jgi:hypothetical protein
MNIPLVFNKYFYKNKKLKLYFRDCVAFLNDFIYRSGSSTFICLSLPIILKQWLFLSGNFVRHVEEVKTGEKSASLHLHRRVRRKTGKTDRPNQRNNKKNRQPATSKLRKERPNGPTGLVGNWARRGMAC